MARYLSTLDEKIFDLSCRVNAIETFLPHHSDVPCESVLAELGENVDQIKGRAGTRDSAIQQMNVLLDLIESGKDPDSSDS